MNSSTREQPSPRPLRQPFATRPILITAVCMFHFVTILSILIGIPKIGAAAISNDRPWDQIWLYFSVLNNANSSAASATHTLVTQQVFNASNGLNWNQPGITSSTVQSDLDAGALTAVGIMLNNDGSGGNLYEELNGTSTFGGQATDANSVLMRYTYLGDLNLDGIVDSQDLNLFSIGYAGGAPTIDWAWGDLNNDGVIDAEDYNLFALGYEANYGLPAIGSPMDIAPVPEPSTWLLATLGFAGTTFFARRKRTHSRN